MAKGLPKQQGSRVDFVCRSRSNLDGRNREVLATGRAWHPPFPGRELARLMMAAKVIYAEF